MRVRFKIILFVLLGLITACSFVFVSSFLLDNESYAMSVVVDYPLSISYPTSNLLDKNNNEDVQISIINSSEEDVLYSINITGLSSAQDATILLEGESLNISTDLEVGDISGNILIKAGDTHDYTVNVVSSDSKFSAQIYISQSVAEDLNFFQTIISNIDTIEEQSLTEVGSEIATTDEGLIKTEVNDEVFYYYRGNIDYNYVSFAEEIWRIVSIDSKGNVKLVLDSTITAISKYYEDSYEFEDSTIYSSLKTWYTNALSDYEDYIYFTSYCSDNTVIDSLGVYSAYNRVVNNSIATLTCIDEVSYSNIALLSVDEVIYAGASYEEANSEFYLINDSLEEDFYLMSGATYKDDIYYPFSLSSNGELLISNSGQVNLGVRPVIIINNYVTATGLGTLDNPYVLSN